jgi:hypothetical protein
VVITFGYGEEHLVANRRGGALRVAMGFAEVFSAEIAGNVQELSPKQRNWRDGR